MVYSFAAGQRKKITFTPAEIEFLGGPLLPAQALWVDSTAANKADSAGAGTKEQPLATLDYAIGRCNAGDSDTILLLPGHAETTTAIAADVAGISIVGLGYGRGRPTLTATTAASDLLAVSAANVHMENVRLVGAASGVTALLDLTGTDFVGIGLSFEHGAAPLEAITIGAAHRFLFDRCTWLGTANGPDRCLSFEARCNDWTIRSPRFMYGSAGLDNELIKSVKTLTGYLIEDVLALGVDTLVVNLVSSSAAAPDGFWTTGQIMYSAAVASIEDGVAAATSKGLAFGRVYATDATGKASGLIPLSTAS